MFLSTILVFVALSISAVAAYYSIAGLTAIFSAAVIPIIIMGIVLEIGKIAGVVWLHYNWKRAPLLIKSYLVPGVLALMLITSMGIYGFLSKAHLDQTISVGDNSIKIEQLQSKIDRERARIKNAETVLAQLDNAVDVLIKYDRIRGPSGAIATREKQKEERDKLAAIISAAQDEISKLLEQQALLKSEQVGFEAEVGPVKYLAALFNNDSNPSPEELETAIRYVIIIIVLVFDPLAIVLIIAATQGFKWARQQSVIEQVTVTKQKLPNSDSEYSNGVSNNQSNTSEIDINSETNGSTNEVPIARPTPPPSREIKEGAFVATVSHNYNDENEEDVENKEENIPNDIDVDTNDEDTNEIVNDAVLVVKELEEQLEAERNSRIEAERELKSLADDIKFIESDLVELPKLKERIASKDKEIAELKAQLASKPADSSNAQALLNRIADLEHRLKVINDATSQDLNLAIENDRLKNRIAELEAAQQK